MNNNKFLTYAILQQVRRIPVRHAGTSGHGLTRVLVNTLLVSGFLGADQPSGLTGNGVLDLDLLRNCINKGCVRPGDGAVDGKFARLH